MKVLSFTIFCLIAWLNSSQGQQIPRVVCYLNSTSFTREGIGKYSFNDLDIALNFCSHLIYGYAGINSETNKIRPLNEKIETGFNGLYNKVTQFKQKYNHLKILLGVGGNAEPDFQKYLTLLESSAGRNTFINSVHEIVNTYNFDGVDLAWEFPPDKEPKIHSALGSFWKSIKKVFTGNSILDEKSEEHKEEFVSLVRDLKNSFSPASVNKMLTLTVLPNVNSSLFYNIPSLVNYADFVTLATFDFLTPERQPKKADYPAPLYELNDRNPTRNVNYQVLHWISNTCPPSKINVGVPTYGRVWQMTSDSGITGVPPIPETIVDNLKAEPQSLTPGMLSWAEVCAKLPNPSNSYLKGADAPLRYVNDPTKRFGSYGFRIPDNNGEHGLWVGYENPDTAANKAAYVKARSLGGVGIFDLSLDDFLGRCTNDKYPILRAIKHKLQYPS